MKTKEEIIKVVWTKYKVDVPIKKGKQEILKITREIKRIYSDIDPYGEEDWNG